MWSSDLAPIADGLLNESPVTPGGVYYERKTLSPDVRSTEETIAEMQKLASAGKRDHDILKCIGRILWGEFDDIPECASKDYRCYAEAIYTFCRDHIKYVFDPYLVEYVEAPRRILEKRIGDCDSVTPLCVAMWEAIGLKAQFVTIKADHERPDEYSHVYCRVEVPHEGWIVGDPTMPTKWFGWEAPHFFERKYWHGSTDELDTPLDETDSEAVDMSYGMYGLGRTQARRKAGTRVRIPRINGLGNQFDARPYPGIPADYRIYMAGLGAGEQTYDDLQNTWSALSDDFNGNVATQDITATSEFAPQRDDIINALARFSSNWLPAVESGQQSVATAASVLDGIATKIDNLKARLAAAASGGSVPPAIQITPTTPLVSAPVVSAPPPPFAAAPQPSYSAYVPPEIKRMAARRPSVTAVPAGMGTGAKVAIGVGAAAVIGLAIYFVARKR
jgi:hypothetical protein